MRVVSGGSRDKEEGSGIGVSSFRSIGRRQLACVVAVFGVLQFFLLTFLAAFFYPGGYDYFEYYFSDLGAVVARNGEVNPVSSALFVLALVLVGFALVPFWLVIRLPFIGSRMERVLGGLGSALGLISCPFIIGVALFPIDVQLEMHFLVFMVFFSCFTVAALLYSIVFVLNRDCPGRFGLLGVVLFAVSLLVFVDPRAPYTVFLQKFLAYGYFVWVLVQVFLVWSFVGPEESTLT